MNRRLRLKRETLRRLENCWWCPLCRDEHEDDGDYPHVEGSS